MPKTTRNGFYFFMKEIMPQLRAEGHVIRGIPDCVPLAHPRYQRLTPDQKAVYDRMAKEDKQSGSQPQKAKLANKQRLDCVGNLIDDRVNEKAEDDSRRAANRKEALASWPKSKEDLKQHLFLFIAFEYLCKTEEGDYLPVEIGVTEYCLLKGITRTFHKFIDPGRIPLGYRAICQTHSTETHQIPIEKFEEAESNYSSIWMQLINFVFPQSQTAAAPILYCYGLHRPCVTYCLDWLHQQAKCGGPNRLTRVFNLEDMIVDLYAHADRNVASFSVIDSIITTTVFDYDLNTRCVWHENKETTHCALGTTKRYAFSISDALATVYDFHLTPAHLPVRAPAPIAQTSLPVTFQPSSARFQSRSNERGRSAKGWQGGFGDDESNWQQRGGQVGKLNEDNSWQEVSYKSAAGRGNNRQQMPEQQPSYKNISGRGNYGQQMSYQNAANSNSFDYARNGNGNQCFSSAPQQPAAASPWSAQPSVQSSNQNNLVAETSAHKMPMNQNRSNIFNQNRPNSSNQNKTNGIGFGSRDVRYANISDDEDDDDDDDMNDLPRRTTLDATADVRQPISQGVCERIMSMSLEQRQDTEKFAQSMRMTSVPLASTLPNPQFPVPEGRGRPVSVTSSKPRSSGIGRGLPLSDQI